MTPPTTITAGRVQLVVRPNEVRITNAGLPAGHAVTVVATTAAECRELQRAAGLAAEVLENLQRAGGNRRP